MKLAEIARRLGCELRGDAAEVEIVGVASLEEAAPGQLAFLANAKHHARLAGCRASAIIGGPDMPPVSIPVLVHANPYLSFARAVRLFHEPCLPPPGVHPSAVVDPTATLGADVSIGPRAVVGARCRLAAHVVVHANATLYPDVEVGEHTQIHSGVVVREGSRLGARVVLQPGCILGGDGFGFAPDDEGRYHPIPQTGIVVLEDDVEIGANTTVDRAALGETRIGAGTKIDNLVMVAHGVTIGRNTVVAAQVGFAGSTRVGNHVQVGGQAGTAGHLSIGDGARIVGRSGVHGDVAPGATVSGFPELDVRVWRRAVAVFAKLPQLASRVRQLERAAELPDG